MFGYGWCSGLVLGAGGVADVMLKLGVEFSLEFSLALKSGHSRKRMRQLYIISII